MPMMITRRVIIERLDEKPELAENSVSRITEEAAVEECVKYQDSLGYRAREDDYLDAWVDGQVVIKDVIIGPFRIAVAYYWHGHSNFRVSDDIEYLKLNAM